VIKNDCETPEFVLGENKTGSKLADERQEALFSSLVTQSEPVMSSDSEDYDDSFPDISSFTPAKNDLAAFQPDKPGKKNKSGTFGSFGA
jgi:hypothetical protein